MRIVDSHFHWWPRSVFEALRKRKGFPRVEMSGEDYVYLRNDGEADYKLTTWPAWFDLDEQLAQMDGLGHDIDVVCSIGPFSVAFSELPASEGRDLAYLWNEEMADAQKKYPGRVWASGAVPLQDTNIALQVMDHAINDLGLIGLNLPGSVGADPHIDAERLEPFYDRAEGLGLPLFLHPTDAVFSNMLTGYNGSLFLSLGRVMEVSVAAMRLVLSGTMDRHPNLKVVLSHTGGALPYQSGRMDKNTKQANLPHPASTYLKRFYTDTVSPHSEGMKFAMEYFGVDRIMYGSDYPCWNPADALMYLDGVGLDKKDKAKVMGGNAHHILGLGNPLKAAAE
ncbi:MAG: amidohydrolase family protein [Pseudomonadota bacterium]|nr:amidohydrolase family protein [Pseudomonadota bacterium]